MADDNDDPEDRSIRQLIREAGDKARATIETLVWDALSSTVQKELGRAQLRRMIAAELANPDQLEFLLDGEPYPLEDVPPELLLRRGNRMVAGGRKLIERGETYIAKAEARRKAEKLEA